MAGAAAAATGALQSLSALSVSSVEPGSIRSKLRRPAPVVQQHYRRQRLRRHDVAKCVRGSSGTSSSSASSPSSTASTSALSSASASIVSDNAPAIAAAKDALFAAIEGTDRGIFSVTSAKRAEIDALAKALEALNPVPNPTENLRLVAGDWQLLYTTISIQGSRRTKLGLRGFITLGNLFQSIDTEQCLANNTVEFLLAGLGLIKGELAIVARYQVTSPTRVDITFEQATLEPEMLRSLFEKNYDLLLSIFNPEGWLDITYVDDDHRIGRDNKGNLFILARHRA
eukprot:jgi/Chlat1/3088/Chrsp21S03326